MRRFYILFSFFCLSFSSFAGGVENGSISGKVTDSKTGEPIPGASVLIDGTVLGSNTDLDGHFKIEPVLIGSYTIVCRYLSYQTKAINEVIVTTGNNTVLNITLEESTQELSEVVVEATARRESQTALLLMQQKNISVSDGISSETIRRTPDRSAGDALKRVSGTSMMENKYVIVRGLSDRYNSAMLNNSPLPSTEPDRKTFSFDLFPSPMIDNIQIIKTASPDLPGEFAGGIVQVNTKDIPEENFYQFSEGIGYNSQTTFKEYVDYKGGKTDFIGIDDGTRALPDTFPSVEEFNKLSKASKIKYSKLFDNDWETREEPSAPLNTNYLYAMGQNVKFWHVEMGSVFSLSYNKSQTTTVVDRKDFADTSRLYDYHDAQYKKNILAGGIWNLSFKLWKNHKIKFQNMYNITSEDNTTKRTGEWFETQQYIRSSLMMFESTRLRTHQLSGEHLLPWKKIKLKWCGSYGKMDKSVPDLRRTYYARNFVPNDEADTLFTAYIPPTASPTYGGKFYSDLDETIKNGSADISVPVNILKTKHTIKAGAWLQNRERTFDARVMGFVVNDFLKFYMNGGQQLLLLPEDQIFDTTHINVNGFRMDEITKGSDHYAAASNLTAGYIMSDSYFTEKLRSVFGVRVESYHTTLNTMGYSLDTINTDTTYTDYLPSVNLTYSLTPKINFRAAYSRTVSRPEFREVAPFVFFDFNLFNAVVGNPKLQRGIINNFDLRAEWYPGFGQMVAITGFYKIFKNPVEQVFSFTGGGSRSLTFENVPGAVNYGGEIEFRKNFDFATTLTTWKFWKNLYVFSNFSLIKSKVDLSSVITADSSERALQGQSPFLLNAGIQYNGEKGFGFMIVVNRIGRRIIQVGTVGYPDVYENPRTVLDAQVSKKFGKYVEAKIGLGDYYHQDSVLYQDNDKDGKYDETIDNTMARYPNGFTVSGGLTFKF